MEGNSMVDQLTVVSCIYVCVSSLEPLGSQVELIVYQCFYSISILFI